MAKPRTNDDAVQHWADSILATEDVSALDVNSIEIRDGAIFHYGTHWPMGVIERHANGRVKRVFVNSNDCSKQSGWGHPTNSVNSDVIRAARHVAAKRDIPVISVPMGSRYVSDDSIRCKPKDSDPEPPANWRCEIPTYFRASDPGEVPVDDEVGCIARTREEFEYSEEGYMHANEEYAVQDQAYTLADPNDYFSRDIIPGAFIVAYTGSGQRTLRIKRAYMGSIYWGRTDYWWSDQREQGHHRPNRGETPGEVYKQCPHCAAYRAKLEAWTLRMYGPTYGAKRGKGWKLYSELIERYGSVDEWKSERLIEFRRVRDGRKAHAAWLKRNTMPQDYVPRLGAGSLRYVPKLDSDGLPFRKDSERYFLLQRKAERAERRREREAAARERHRRQVERFACQMRARRGTSFTQRAANIARELAAVNAALSPTTELESDDA